MNKDIWQRDCLDYLEHVGAEVYSMDDLDHLVKEHGAQKILEMALQGGSSNGMVVRDTFDGWDFSAKFDTEQPYILVLPSWTRMASIFLYDAESIVRQMYLLDEFDEWNTARLWDELEVTPFSEGDEGILALEVDWHGFPAGTPREEIWRWFDRRHPKGVAYLLYGEET